MEVDSAGQAPGDGAVVGEAADSEETDIPHWPTIASPEQAGLFVWGGWCPVGGRVGVGGLHCGAKQTD